MSDKRVEAVATTIRATEDGLDVVMSDDEWYGTVARAAIEAADAADDHVRVPRALAWQLLQHAKGTGWGEEMQQVWDASQ